MCRNDFLRRWNLFKYLVQSVISYGVELWGWEEREELENKMLDYIRWLFRLDFCTPTYIIRRELGMEKLRIGWGIRAMRFEARIKMGKEKLMKECLKEKKAGKWKDLYRKERVRFYARYRIEVEENAEGGSGREEEEMMEKEKKQNGGELEDRGGKI